MGNVGSKGASPTFSSARQLTGNVYYSRTYSLVLRLQRLFSPQICLHGDIRIQMMTNIKTKIPKKFKISIPQLKKNATLHLKYRFKVVCENISL